MQYLTAKRTCPMSLIHNDYELAPQKVCQKIAGGVCAMTWSRWEKSGSGEPVGAVDLDMPDESDKTKFPTAYVIRGRKYYCLAELYQWLETHRGKPTGEIPDAEAGRQKGRTALAAA